MRPDRRGGKLYLEDPYRRVFDAEVLESADGWSVGNIKALTVLGGPEALGRLHRDERVLGAPERLEAEVFGLLGHEADVDEVRGQGNRDADVHGTEHTLAVTIEPCGRRSSVYSSRRTATW